MFSIRLIRILRRFRLVPSRPVSGFFYKRCLNCEVIKVNNIALPGWRFVNKSLFSTGFEGENFDGVFLKLSRDVFGENRVRLSDVEAAVTVLSGQKDVKNKSLFLLECCGKMLPDVPPKQRTVLAKKVLEIAQRGGDISEAHFERLLACHLDNNCNVMVRDVMSEMAQVGVTPSEKILQLLLACVSERGNLAQMAAVISAIKGGGFASNQQVLFSCLIIGHSKAGDVSSARQVLETMKTAHLTPGPEVVTALMRSAAMTGDLASLHHYYTMLGSPDDVTCSQLLSVADTAAISGNVLLLPVIVEWLRDTPLDTIQVENTIVRWIHSGYGLAALKLLPLTRQQRSDGEPRRLDFFVCEELVLAETPIEKIITICKQLRDQGYPYAFDAAVGLLLRSGKRTQELPKLYEEFKKLDLPLRPHYFWPVILDANRNDGESGIWPVLMTMVRLGVAVDEHTLRDFVLPHLSIPEPKSLLTRLRNATALPLSSVLLTYISHLARRGCLADVSVLCSTYKDTVLKFDSTQPLEESLVLGLVLSKDIQAAVSILSMCPHLKLDAWLHMLTSQRRRRLDHNELLQLLQALKSANLLISNRSCELLNERLARMLAPPELLKALRDLSGPVMSVDQPIMHNKFQHPNDMNLEDLECHLLELEAKGMNTRGVLRRLLQLNCRHHNIERALQIMEQLLASGVELSPGMKSCFLDAYIHKGDADSALTWLADISETNPSFDVDSYKIINLATVLVRQGKTKDARALLQRFPNKKTSTMDLRSVEKNCHRLLMASVETKMAPTVTAELLEVMISNKFCESSNVILGSLVRAIIESGNIDAAVSAYLQCCKNSRKTPQQQELMNILVEKKDWASLEEVAAASTMVHGESSTVAALVVAHAKTGDPVLLDSYLTKCKPNLKTPNFKDNCTRLHQLGDVRTLQTLVATSRTHGDRLNTAELVDLVFKTYHQTGDSKAALDYYRSLLQMDISIPEAVKASLGAMLVSSSPSMTA